MRWIPAYICAALLLSSCTAAPASPGGSGTTTTGSVAGAPTAAAKANFGPSTTLNIRLEGPWDTFDPNNSANLPSTQLNAALYDRLLWMTPDKQLVPYLASSWEQSGNTLKFTLRKNVTCNDGTPLTASAVAQSFDRLLGISDPKTRSTTSIGEFGPGPFTLTADDATGVFTLTLASPWGEALQSTATGGDTYVLCPKGLEAGAPKDAAVGAGPDTIAAADRSSGITLKVRSDWTWGPNGRTAEGLPGQLVYKIVTNETTASNLLLTGGLDIARIQGPDVQRLLQNNSVGQFKATGW